jgi:hypothetical protein
VVIQLVEAILSCNRHGIAHRDIKLSNITFPLSKKQERRNIAELNKKQNKNQNFNQNLNKNQNTPSGKDTEKEGVRDNNANMIEIPQTIKKSLSATFLPFQNSLQKVGDSQSANEGSPNDGYFIADNTDFIFEGDIDYGNGAPENQRSIGSNNNNININNNNNNINNIDNSNIYNNNNNNRNQSKDTDENNSSSIDNDDDSEVEKGEEDIYIKLADFGMAGFIGKDGRLRGRCGTPGKYLILFSSSHSPFVFFLSFPSSPSHPSIFLFYVFFLLIASFRTSLHSFPPYS